MPPDNFDLSNVMFQLFDHSVETIVVMDTEGRILYANHITVAYGGVPMEKVLGNILWQVYPDTVNSVHEEYFHHCVREQTPVTFEYYHPPTEKWFEVRYYPSPDAVALFGSDITERKRQMEAIQESEEKYRVLLNSVDQGFCLCEMLWDAEGKPTDYRFLEVNPAFEQMSGLANAKGQTMFELVPDFESFWAERYAAMLAEGVPIHFQQSSEVMGRVFDVFAAGAGGSRFVILFTDISEKVRRDQENEALNARLRRSMQETHHRVKNNLQVIASLVEMQAADMENPVAATPLLRINQHVQALAVIHDLLTQQAKTDEDTEYIGTQAVLNQLIPLLRQTIGERKITAKIDDVILTAEKAASFALLVSECVSNAVKHSSGEIEITLKRENNRAVLKICDDGDGFPDGFDPRTAANTGLQLIESAARWDLGGDVKYDNHGLGGGRVVVTFPIAAARS